MTLNNLCDASLWSDPAFYISLAALGLSAIQFIRSIRLDAKTRKRIEFTELIDDRFSGINAVLDSLEYRLKKASTDSSVASNDILEVALQAVRMSNRVLTYVSEMPAVSSDLLESSGIDELEEILTMIDEGRFCEPSRSLSINTALKTVTRVAIKCSKTHREVRSIHLD